MTEKHLNWKDHLNLTEEKLFRNLGLLYKPKQFPNAKTMQKYINYENVICCSTYTNKPKILFSKQNQAI